MIIFCGFLFISGLILTLTESETIIPNLVGIIMAYIANFLYSEEY